MAFNLKTFLLDLAEAGPAIFETVMNIKQEAPTASKAQMATDALNAATGVSTALLSTNPDEQADAQAASAIAASVITAIAAKKSPTPAVVG